MSMPAPSKTDLATSVGSSVVGIPPAPGFVREGAPDSPSAPSLAHEGAPPGMAEGRQPAPGRRSGYLRWVIPARDDWSPGPTEFDVIRTLLRDFPDQLRAADVIFSLASQKKSLFGLKNKAMLALPAPYVCHLCAFTGFYVEQEVAHRLTKLHRMAVLGLSVLCRPCGRVITKERLEMHKTRNAEHIRRVQAGAFVSPSLERTFAPQAPAWCRRSASPSSSSSVVTTSPRMRLRAQTTKIL